jgi:hypothetical protein
MPNNFTKVEWLKGVNLIDAPNMLREGEVQQTRNMVPHGPRGLLSSRSNAAYTRMLASTETGGGGMTLGANSLPLSMNFIDLTPTQPSTTGNALSWIGFSFVQDATASPLVIALGAHSEGYITFPYTTGVLPTQTYGSWRTGTLTQMPVSVNYLTRQLWFSNTRTVAGQDANEMFGVIDYNGVANPGYMDFVPGYFAGTNNSGIRPAGACVYRQRLVAWGPKEGYEDCLIFTDNNSFTIGDNVISNNRFQRVGSDRVPIVSCIPVMLAAAGTPAQAGLLILKQSGAYLLTGEPNQSDETTYFTGNPEMQIIRFNVDATCLSHHSVVQTPYGIVWCGIDDVWVFQADMVPYRVGTKLNPAIRAAAISGYGWRASAAFYAGLYRLALPVPAVTPTINDPQNQYWLELRNGMPRNFEEAAWFGPQVYADGTKLSAAAVDTRTSKVPYLYAAGRVTYVSGTIRYGLPLMQMDANRSGQDTFASNTQLTIQLRTNNYPTAKLVTQDYDFGDSMTDKVYTGTEIALKTANDLPVSVKASMNGDLDQNTETDLLFKNTANSYITSLAYPNDATRPIGTDVSIEMTQLGGYIITAANHHVKFIETGSNARTANITQGHYANIVDLVNAICAAMTQHSHNNRTYTQGVVLPYFNGAITASAGTWVFDTTDAVSVALTALIGYTQSSYTPAISQTAATLVGVSPAYPFDLDSVILRTFTIPRRPAV